MKNLETLTRGQVSDENALIFDALKTKIGMVPNLYATVANSNVALKALLDLGQTLGGGEFSGAEVEAIALAVAEANSCDYCLAAHTAAGKMQGLTQEETIKVRTGEIEDVKLKILTDLARDITLTRGYPSPSSIERFFDVGYTKAALVDLIGFVANNIFTNYLNHIAGTEIDFPKAPKLPELV
ncbi:MAG: carboxymuconolactone decarboxylase family protein [Bacteroidetes bacterium]|nr:carboxymuconolactone decarboxylase family protein [Bacteroidota bacterium]